MPAKKLIRPILISLATALLGACATTVPGPIRDPIPGSPTVAEVRAKQEVATGTRVRWGGHIASVANLKNHSEIQVVSRPLVRGGRPRETDQTEGRFIVRVPEFLDPAIYVKGRELTTLGTIESVRTQTIDRHPYRFPVVAIESLYLWPPRPEHGSYNYPPYWYSPYPWYYNTHRNYRHHDRPRHQPHTGHRSHSKSGG